MKQFLSILVVFFLFGSQNLTAQKVEVTKLIAGNTINFQIENNCIRQNIVIKNNLLTADTLESLENRTKHFRHTSQKLISDADFAIHVVWNGWLAPGKTNNADNPVVFSKKDFHYLSDTISSDPSGTKTLMLYFKGINNSFRLTIAYRLSQKDFYIRRNIAIADPKEHGHFLDKIDSRKGWMTFSDTGTNLPQTFQILNKGRFGQPIAFKNQTGGGFIGLEYPTSTNLINKQEGGHFLIDCFQYFGQKIDNNNVKSNWVVSAITPEPYVKKWFFTYTDALRVAPARPYILYNSWYDLRSADYPRVPKNAVMNEKNTLRIARLLQENMIKKNGIHLDAFVLDDGWDIYASDWKLRRKQFPNGLKPIADTLAKTNTTLGLWFGPTGGYSFAMKRVKWMGEHGYEVTGHKYVYGSAMMCLAGQNYSALFRKRTTDFVKNDGVGYFKWDGIQFVCSEPGHGHPVGIYSRRAVMQSVIDKCQAVRAINPKVYLNITSGTWLSPWWLSYANQIWMDAADYGFSDVPSISRRDNAMTYRDFALYNDFKIRNLWFPVANLMTHGIIKGRLENISKGGESLDRFTNNAVLYFARGVSMWELYISPDILTPNEWHALSQSIKWAHSRFQLMQTTFMVGGNPAKGNSYGYVHFVGSKGLIAVRNPQINSDTIHLKLSPVFGLNEKAKNLVVEQIYPYRKIFPKLYVTGQIISIYLNAYETAVFDIYPAESTHRPLLADVIFDLKTNGKNLNYKIYKTGNNACFLKPENIRMIKTNRHKISMKQLFLKETPLFKAHLPKIREIKNHDSIIIKLTEIPQNIQEIALLFQNKDNIKGFPKVSVLCGHDTLTTEKQSSKNKWLWTKTEFKNSKPLVLTIYVKKAKWKGRMELWMKTTEKQKGFAFQAINKKVVREHIMPPLPQAAGTFSHYDRLESKEIL